MPVVIVVGSSNLDFTVTVERLPAVGETVLGGALQEAFGGKGANQAVAARLAGAEVRLLTKLGADEHGRRIAAHLTGLGLPRKGLLQEATAPTGVALILVDRQGRNVIAVAPGANQALRVEDVRRAEPLLDGGQVLLVQLEIPLACVAEALRRARARRLFTILNPAPAMSLPASLYPLIDLLTPNAREAEALTGLREPAAAARALVGRGAGAVVVTLGEQGALLCQGDLTATYAAYPVQAIDTTAAGDAFNGALACALAEGRTLRDAVPFALAAGALATTKPGAQPSLPLRSDILRLCGT